MTSLPTTTLTAAAHQWATRPDDERFLSLTQMRDEVYAQRCGSKAAVVSSKQLEAVVGDDGVYDLRIRGANGAAYAPTNWAFGQIAGLAGVAAPWLRKAPAGLVADNINWGLQCNRDVEDVGVLLRRDASGRPFLAAATGPNYGRTWNFDLCDALIDKFGDGVTGDWRIPGEFGVQGQPITKQNTTLYASDRDMFVFLADETNRIQLPNRRGGRTGSLARGFFLSSSEVGARSLSITGFLFDYMCGNHLVWGAQEISKLAIRHTASAPDRWLGEVVPLLNQYANTTAAPLEARLQAAQKAKVDNVETFLKNRKWTGSMIAKAQAAHEAEEGRPIETIWDIVTGATAAAKAIQFMDARVDYETAAGKLLDLVDA